MESYSEPRKQVNCPMFGRMPSQLPYRSIRAVKRVMRAGTPGVV